MCSFNTIVWLLLTSLNRNAFMWAVGKRNGSMWKSWLFSFPSVQRVLMESELSRIPGKTIKKSCVEASPKVGVFFHMTLAKGGKSSW